MTRILFVCLGNICRSPTAESVMRHQAVQAGRGDAFQLDSAGTGGWHAGAPPDARATAAALRRGIVLEGAARAFQPKDFDSFDMIVAMDRENRAGLLRLARDGTDMRKISLLRDHDPTAGEDAEVPDPYYGGADGFDDVLDMVERACRGLLAACP